MKNSISNSLFYLTYQLTIIILFLIDLIIFSLFKNLSVSFILSYFYANLLKNRPAFEKLFSFFLLLFQLFIISPNFKINVIITAIFTLLSFIIYLFIELSIFRQFLILTAFTLTQNLYNLYLGLNNLEFYLTIVNIIANMIINLIILKYMR